MKRHRFPGLADPHHDQLVCICVDGFGSDVGTNRAALRLTAMERVHAIGCSVSGEAWKTWSRLLRRLDADGVDIGLRLNLTDAAFLARSRRSLKALVAASWTGQLDRRGLRAEIRAQLDTFEQVIGHAPAFIDSHQQVHALSGIRLELLDELEHRYGGFRPWVRSTRSVAGEHHNGFRRLVESLSARGLSTLTRQRGYPQNRRLLAVPPIEGGLPRYRDVWLKWLRTCGDAHLLACRPTMGGDEDDCLVDARDLEFQWLSSAAFGELLQFCGVALWPMSQILAYHGSEP